jgi:hypothetical protein
MLTRQTNEELCYTARTAPVFQRLLLEGFGHLIVHMGGHMACMPGA